MKALNGIERWRGEVTATLIEIQKSLERLQTGLDKAIGEFHVAMRDHAERDDRSFREQHQRLTILERSVGKIALIGAGLGVIVGALVEYGLSKLVG